MKLRLRKVHLYFAAAFLVAAGIAATSQFDLTTQVRGILAAANGGTGTGSTLTGIVRGGSPMTAAELSGDCTTSGSNAITCTKTSGTLFAASATTNTVNASNISSGTLAAARMAATPLSTGTTLTLTAPRDYLVCTSTCTITVPVPAAGDEFCVMNDDNVSTVITLSAIGSSARYENTSRTAYGTAGTGTMVSGAAAANKICLIGRDSTHYLVGSFNGTWTAN